MEVLKARSELVPAARKEGDTVIVSIRGEIDLHRSAEVRSDLLGFIAKHEPARLILNLAEVPYMDSSAIAVLVEAMQKMRKFNGRIILTDLQPRVKGLLEIARLGTIFVFALNEAEAMAK